MTDPVRSPSDAARRDEWWRGMPITDFADAVDRMTTKEHEALAAELASVSAIVKLAGPPQPSSVMKTAAAVSGTNEFLLTAPPRWLPAAVG